MTSDQPRSAESSADPINLAQPDFAIPDAAAIRRAMRRGVLRTSFVAACWLLLGAFLLTVGWVTIGAFRTERFARIALSGVEVAHPEYEISEGHFANFGTSTMELQLRPRGVIGHHGAITGQVRQPVFGGIQVDLGQPAQTPILEALDRGRPDTAATVRFIDSLPVGVSTSAVVEMRTPLDREAFATFLAAQNESSAVTTSIFLTARYAAQPTVTWPSPRGLDEYVSWAGRLRSSDDHDLATLGLPTASVLRTVARDPRIYAFVIDRASVAELRDLLSNPLIRSVNVADVGFDVTEQARPR